MSSFVDVNKVIHERLASLEKVLKHPIIRNCSCESTPIFLRRRTCSPFPRQRKIMKKDAGKIDTSPRTRNDEKWTYSITEKQFLHMYAKSFIMSDQPSQELGVFGFECSLPVEHKQKCWRRIYQCYDHGYVIHDVTPYCRSWSSNCEKITNTASRLWQKIIFPFSTKQFESDENVRIVELMGPRPEEFLETLHKLSTQFSSETNSPFRPHISLLRVDTKYTILSFSTEMGIRALREYTSLSRNRFAVWIGTTRAQRSFFGLCRAFSSFRLETQRTLSPHFVVVFLIVVSRS